MFVLSSKEAVQRGKVGPLLRASRDSWAGGGARRLGQWRQQEAAARVAEKSLLLAGRIASTLLRQAQTELWAVRRQQWTRLGQGWRTGSKAA